MARWVTEPRVTVSCPWQLRRRSEPQEEKHHAYGSGDLVVYTALLTLDAHYSGQAAQGKYRALVVWVRRDGRWQQVASQLTLIAGQ